MKKVSEFDLVENLYIGTFADHLRISYEPYRTFIRQSYSETIKCNEAIQNTVERRVIGTMLTFLFSTAKIKNLAGNRTAFELSGQ